MTKTWSKGTVRIAQKHHLCDHPGCKKIIAAGSRYFDSDETHPTRAGGFDSKRVHIEHAAAPGEPVAEGEETNGTDDNNG